MPRGSLCGLGPQPLSSQSLPGDPGGRPRMHVAGGLPELRVDGLPDVESDPSLFGMVFICRTRSG